MDKKVAIGLCLVSSLVVTLSAPAYANQGGHTSNPSNSGDVRNHTSNPSNSGDSNTGNNNGGGTSTVQNPPNGNTGNTGNSNTVQNPPNGNNGVQSCSLADLLWAVLGRNSDNEACREMAKVFDQVALKLLEQVEERVREIFRTPGGVYANTNPRRSTGSGGSDLLRFVNSLNPLRGLFGGSQREGDKHKLLSGFSNPRDTYWNHSNDVARLMQRQLASNIKSLATRGARLAEQTKNGVRQTVEDADKKSQEEISKLDEWSKDDGGKPQNELEALLALLRLTGLGNKIKSTGFKTVNATFQAGNQINAEGHATTAYLLTQILEAQYLSVQAQMVADAQRAQVYDHMVRLFDVLNPYNMKAHEAALTFEGGVGEP
jgi:hypothetical protein